MLVASAVAVIAIVRKSMPIAFALNSIVLLLLLTTISTPTPNGTDAFLSMRRAIIPSIPVVLVLAVWANDRPWLAWLLLGGGLCLEATLAAFFINGGFLV